MLSLLSNLVALCWLVALISVVILLRGLWPRTLGDHPHCRKCEYDLFGLPAEATHCPECNAPIRGAVRVGRRVRNLRLAALGLALGAAAFAVAKGAERWEEHLREQPRLFRRAVETGDLATMNRMLAEHPEYLQGRFQSGQTKPDWIERAIYRRQLAVMQRLLVLGMDPNSPEALGTAVETGWHEGAEALLKCGADPNRAALRGQPLLSQAIAYQDPRMMELLLDHGAKIDTRDADGRTQLHLAFKFHSLEIAKLLIARGADLTSTDSAGRLPGELEDDGGEPRAVWVWWELLDQAEKAGTLAETVAKLQAAPRVFKLVDINGQSLFHIAERHKRTAILRALLDVSGEAGLTATDRRGDTVFHQAAADGHDQIVSMLLDAGADPKRRNKHGQTPLLCAARNSRREIVELLLQRGADLTETDAYGGNALHAMAIESHLGPSNVQAFAERGLKPDIFIFVALGDRAAVERELARDPGLALATVDGWTPLHVAARHNRMELIDVLLAHGANIDARVGPSPSNWPAGASAAHVALRTAGRNGALAHLVERGIDLSIADDRGDTVLHAAVTHADAALLRMLVDGGAPLNAVNRGKFTPLGVARWNQRKPAIDLLTALGADPGER